MPSPTSPKAKMSKKKKAAIALLIILALPFVYALLVFSKQTIKTHSAKHKVTVARDKIEQSTDQKVANFETALINSGAVGPKLASSKASVCYVTHADQGWFAVNWYQDCYLRYVEGFSTNLSRETFKAKLSGSTDLLTAMGELSNEDKFYPSTCVISDRTDKFKVSYLPINFTKDEAFSCDIPNQLQGLTSVDGPIILDNELAIKRYVNFDPAPLINNGSQVWFEHDEFYYHEDLGCGIDYVFCGNPRSKPAQ